MSCSAGLGGVGLFVDEHILDQPERHAEHGPVQRRRVLRRSLVDAPAAPSEVANCVVQAGDVAIQLVLASLAAQPGEPDLLVQPDHCPADQLWLLSPRDRTPSDVIEGSCAAPADEASTSWSR